jgi:hypothetical protein
MINELEKYEGSGRDLIQGIVTFALKDGGKLRKP